MPSLSLRAVLTTSTIELQAVTGSVRSSSALLVQFLCHSSLNLILPTYPLASPPTPLSLQSLYISLKSPTVGAEVGDSCQPSIPPQPPSQLAAGERYEDLRFGGAQNKPQYTIILILIIRTPRQTPLTPEAPCRPGPTAMLLRPTSQTQKPQMQL